MDLETVGYLSGELSGFFAHVAKALEQKSSAGSLPPSLFAAPPPVLALAPPKNGRKAKKAKTPRAPRCGASLHLPSRLEITGRTSYWSKLPPAGLRRAVSAYNQFVKEKVSFLLVC